MQDYSTLKQQIINDIKEDSKSTSKALKQMIQTETANYQTVAEYSKSFGESISKSIKKNIGEEIPAEELGQFATECLAPIYRQSQDTMLNACENVQKTYNKQAGIDLSPANVKQDESRIQNIIKRFEESDNFKDVAFLTESNVAKSITRGAVQDSIRENSKLQSDAGLKIRISRSDGSGCCDWCSSVTGTFDSFDALPEGFWGIHRGCNCVIDYRVGKTRNKISFNTDEKGNLTKITEEIKENKELTFAEKKAVIDKNEEKIQKLLEDKKAEELKFIMGSSEEVAKASENISLINDEIEKLRAENEKNIKELGLPNNPKERFSVQKIDYSKLPQDIRPNEEKAVSSWTRTDYTYINDYMRFDNKGVRPESIENAKVLQNMLDRNIVQEPFTVRRGTDFRAMDALFGSDSWRKEDYNVEGKIITDKGFFATTPNEKGGFTGGIRMYIDVPKGAKGAYIEKYSAASNEKEFLLQANTSFIVDKIETVKNRWGESEYNVFMKVKV